MTIRSRVDGQVDKIAFTENQDVEGGDLLAQWLTRKRAGFAAPRTSRTIV